jgi:thiol:disulfide interchange protein
VIFIVSFTDKKYTIPLLVMLLGVALGLWMIGNLYDINSHIRHKMTVRLTALVLTALICWLGFGLTGENKHSLPWEPFSEARVAALLKEHKTVLIDFTAEWCTTCHVNEYVALDTQETKELVELNGIIPLKADFTNESAEIKRWLNRFKQAGVPLVVIFPGQRPKMPIVLDGVYTKGKLLQKLKEAVRVPLPPNARTEPATVVR